MLEAEQLNNMDKKYSGNHCITGNQNSLFIIPEHILFCVQENKQMHTGLEQEMMRVFSFLSS